MNQEVLEEKLGYSFRQKELLTQALTHPSCSYEERRQVGDNQRLEFLGDAVLQMTLTHRLYRDYPTWDEGRLTRLRARLVNRNALEQFARELELGEHLILGKGETKNQGRSKASNLADAFEAVLGAIFLDAGYAETVARIEKIYLPHIRREAAAPDEFNAKGALQEWLQARGKSTPTYDLVSESGPDHDKNYEIAVISEGQDIAHGTGSSKKAAEMEAAARALEVLRSGETS